MQLDTCNLCRKAFKLMRFVRKKAVKLNWFRLEGGRADVHLHKESPPKEKLRDGLFFRIILGKKNSGVGGVVYLKEPLIEPALRIHGEGTRYTITVSTFDTSSGIVSKLNVRWPSGYFTLLGINKNAHGLHHLTRHAEDGRKLYCATTHLLTKIKRKEIDIATGLDLLSKSCQDYISNKTWE